MTSHFDPDAWNRKALRPSEQIYVSRKPIEPHLMVRCLLVAVLMVCLAIAGLMNVLSGRRALSSHYSSDSLLESD